MVGGSEQSIVILTGAGISKESGLDTFRDADGIWSKVRIEDVATPEAFRQDPTSVQEFYNSRRQQLINSNIKPNAAHIALAKLEREWPGTVSIVTQNIDNLHEMGGSKVLIHMHGELLKVRCLACLKINSWSSDINKKTICPNCNKINALRPHVVWFGEMPLHMEKIHQLLNECSIFISIGTSGNVYPAAGFVQLATIAGARSIELNLEPSEGATLFTDARYGAATKIVPAYVDELLQEGL